MSAGFDGLSIDVLVSEVPKPLDISENPIGFMGVSVDVLITETIRPIDRSLPPSGFLGISIDKFLRRLNSLAFGNLLPFVTNPRLDELKVTMPDGRIFSLGSNLAYGTISVPFCFFDEADEGEILVTGYRRATWPNPIGERFEYFETMI